MPFGEHLCADQQAGRAALNTLEDVLHGLLARHALAVDTQHREIREALRQVLFGTLGPGAQGAQIGALAFWAATLGRALGIAVMAMQAGRVLVHGHARIAAGAFGYPAAVMAHQGRSKAAPVDKHQHLIALLEVFANGFDHRSA